LKILILGANGQVGSALVKILKDDYQIKTTTRKNLDCEKSDKIIKYFKKKHFDLIINAVAYTKVDQAEEETKRAYQLNVLLPKMLAQIANKMNAALIHYSTDYVFDGQSSKDYYEQSNANPLNVYGKTKLQGDLAIIQEKVKGYILRVAWVYGNKDHSFLNKIQNQINKKKQLRVVNDQFGIPTSATFIAKITKKLIDRKNFNHIKVYNLSPKGKCSWFDFTKEYLHQKKITHVLTAISADDIQQKAKRPQSVKLNSSKLEKYLKMKFKDWKGVLKTYLYER
jgi:dTDP-4-dehydrorhamnose reductase